jgi:transposase InsO family protein
MHQAGRRAHVTCRYQATPDSAHGGPVADHGLAQQFMAAQPPATGRADITYVATDEGWLYRASLEDRAPRPIVGGALDARLTQDLVLRRATAGVHPLPPRTQPDWPATA